MSYNPFQSLGGELGALSLKRACKKPLDPQQLRMGIREEKEHTRDPETARIIASHHLCLIPNYYSWLAAMEKQALKEMRAGVKRGRKPKLRIVTAEPEPRQARPRRKAAAPAPVRVPTAPPPPPEAMVPVLEPEPVALQVKPRATYLTKWWLRPAPKEEKACYARKADALNIFRQYNEHIIEPYGGPEMVHSCAMFDSVNEKYGLRGKRCAKRIGDAISAALPGAPYCLDRIDLDALNETIPAQDKGGFRLPDFVLEKQIDDKEAEYYRQAEAGEFFGRHDERGWSTADILLGLLGLTGLGMVFLAVRSSGR